MTTTFPTDNRTILDEADGTGGWTGSATVNTGTADPAPVEATNWLGMAVGTSTDDAFTSITSDDYSIGGTLFVWIQANGAMDTQVNGGVAVQVGDGTNRIGYHTGGSDKAAFRHDEGPARWECHVLDLANKPANNTAYAGSEASLDETAITQAGVGYKTLSKALGGSTNCFWDILRYADAGDDVIMQGGTTSGAAGNGAEAAAVDRATGNQQAYGVIRELGSGVYGVQGNLTIGNTASATDQYWEDTNVTYAFEDRDLSDRNYYRFFLVGRTGQTSSIIFTASTFVCPTDASARIDANGADLDVMTMSAVVFSGISCGIVGSDDTGDDWTNCTYINSTALEVNGADHTGSTFSGGLECALVEAQDETSYDNTATEGTWDAGASYAATDTITLENGALLTVDTVSTGAVTEFTVTTSEGYPASVAQAIPQASTSGSGTGFILHPRSANLAEGGSIFYDEAVDPDGELDDMTFTKGTDATHAGVFGPNIPTTITLRGWTVSGYNASDEQTDSTLHFLDTGGTITVNIVDGSGTFSTKSEGATIDLVINPVVTKITVEEQDGTAINAARVFLETADNGGGSGFPFEQGVDSLTQTAGTATCDTTGNHGLATNDYVVIRGAGTEGYNKTAQITVTGVDTFTYSVDSGLGSPAGGTPLVSYVAISGTTSTLGVIQSSKTWPASQGLKGWARKSTSAPFFKQSAINIADASGGTDLLVTLISDE